MVTLMVELAEKLLSSVDAKKNAPVVVVLGVLIVVAAMAGNEKADTIINDAAKTREDLKQVKEVSVAAKNAAVSASASAKEAKQEAADAAEMSASAAQAADANDRRIHTLEEAVKEIKAQRSESRETEKELKAQMVALQVKIGNMDGNQKAQFEAILRELKRLNDK